MKRLSLLVILAALTFIVTVSTGWATPQVVSTTYQMPVRLQASVSESGCDNSPGPYITLDGALTLGGMGVDVIFRNNEKGTHTATDKSDVMAVVVPAGQSLSIPKQPVDGGVGGNPFIWIQLVDGKSNPLTSMIYLGRCVQGFVPVKADFYLPVTATAQFSANGCYNNPGPNITLEGVVALTGINARFLFANNDNPVGGPHQNDETESVDVVVVPPGQMIQIPKQPVLGGVGGNPWISALFETAAGDAIGGDGTPVFGMAQATIEPVVLRTCGLGSGRRLAGRGGMQRHDWLS